MFRLQPTRRGLASMQTHAQAALEAKQLRIQLMQNDLLDYEGALTSCASRLGGLQAQHAPPRVCAHLL